MELPENIYKTNGGLGVVAKVMGGSGGLDWVGSHSSAAGST